MWPRIQRKSMILLKTSHQTKMVLRWCQRQRAERYRCAEPEERRAPYKRASSGHNERKHCVMAVKKRTWNASNVRRIYRWPKQRNDFNCWSRAVCCNCYRMGPSMVHKTTKVNTVSTRFSTHFLFIRPHLSHIAFADWANILPESARAHGYSRKSIA